LTCTLVVVVPSFLPLPPYSDQTASPLLRRRYSNSANSSFLHPLEVRVSLHVQSWREIFGLINFVSHVTSSISVFF